MSGASLSPSAFVARAVSEFCVPAIVGNANWRWPDDGGRLTEEQRAEAGLADPGRTIGFPVGGGVVYVDLSENHAMLWFQHVDARNALPAIEAALKKSHPSLAQMYDAPRETRGMRTRVHAGELGGGKMAQIDLAYMAPGAPPAADDRFKVIVFALILPEDARPSMNGGLKPAPKEKKKGWL